MEKIKKISRLTGALLAKKGVAEPSPASLLLSQQALSRFSSAANHSEKSGDLTDRLDHSGETQSPTEKTAGAKPAENSVAGKRIAMTLRMAREDHLRLRLFSAYTRKSCQVILSEALEQYLGENSTGLPVAETRYQGR